jgi:hypothetical protein
MSPSDDHDSSRHELQYAPPTHSLWRRRLFWPGFFSALLCILSFPWGQLAPVVVGMLFWGEHEKVPWYGVVSVAAVAVAPTTLAMALGLLAVTRSPHRPDRIAGAITMIISLFSLLTILRSALSS